VFSVHPLQQVNRKLNLTAYAIISLGVLLACAILGAVPGLAASLEFHGNYSIYQTFDRGDGTLNNLHNGLWLETRVRPAKGMEVYWANFLFLEHEGARGIGMEQFHATLDTETFDVRLFGRERPTPTGDPLQIFHPNRFGDRNNFSGGEVSYVFGDWKLWASAVKLHDWGSQYSLNGRVETSINLNARPLKLGYTFNSQVWGKWQDVPESGGRMAMAVDAAYQLGPVSLTGETVLFRSGSSAVRAYYLRAQQPIGSANAEFTYRYFPQEFEEYGSALGDPNVLVPGKLTRVAVTYPLASDIRSNVALQKFTDKSKATQTFEAGLNINRTALLSPYLYLSHTTTTPAEGGDSETTTVYRAEVKLPIPRLQVAKVTGEWTTTVAGDEQTTYTLTPEVAVQLNDRVKLEGKARFQTLSDLQPDGVYARATYTVPVWSGYEASLDLTYGAADFHPDAADQLRWQINVRF
jgi:hypothetical protein